MMQMINSKFRMWVIFPLVLAVFLTGFFCFILNDALIDNSPEVRFIYGILFIVIIVSWVWSVFGELRTKAIAVTIGSDSILTRSFIGIGKTKAFSLGEFDGFTTSMLESNYAEYEYLYLMKGNKKMVKISAFYHQNYLEIKQYLAAHVKYLGVVPFSLADDFKEIFQ